jgi:hypothetical protein
MLPEKNCPKEDDTFGTFNTHMTEPPERTNEGLHNAALVFFPLTLAYISGSYIGYFLELVMKNPITVACVVVLVPKIIFWHTAPVTKLHVDGTIILGTAT